MREEVYVKLAERLDAIQYAKSVKQAAAIPAGAKKLVSMLGAAAGRIKPSPEAGAKLRGAISGAMGRVGAAAGKVRDAGTAALGRIKLPSDAGEKLRGAISGAVSRAKEIPGDLQYKAQRAGELLTGSRLKNLEKNKDRFSQYFGWSEPEYAAATKLERNKVLAARGLLGAAGVGAVGTGLGLGAAAANVRRLNRRAALIGIGTLGAAGLGVAGLGAGAHALLSGDESEEEGK